MGKQEFLTGLVAAIIALSALMFAIFQAAVAFSTLMSAVSRCDRRVTGAFDLRAGFWLSILTLTPNVKYRMPVITMPGIRSKIPAMEVEGIPKNFFPGLNFKHNAYVDGKRARIYGAKPRSPVDYRKTAIRILRNILWAPFGALLSLIGCVVCWPTLLCCGGCGSPAMFGLGAIALPLFPLFNNIRRKKGDDVERGINVNPNPELEPASWAQFLLIHQMAWWGHANIRWEWRLASAIPQDLSGATIETTIADIELLALMFGMVPCNDPNIVARSPCGEEIVSTEHQVLGRLIYYRSGRENIQRKILASSPKEASRWLHLCIQAARKQRTEFFQPQKAYLAIQDPKDLDSLDSLRDNVVHLFSRRRSVFDAQLQFSCGRAMWLFTDDGFLRAEAGFSELGRVFASEITAKVSMGPIGSGVNSCSCIHCCKEWFSENNASERRWALLDTKRTNDVIWIGTAAVGPHFDVILQIQRLCWRNCDVEDCACDFIARAPESKSILSLEHSIAILAINTAWLSKVPDLMLRQAAESVLLGIAANPVVEAVRNVSVTMAYTERLLLDVRRQTGATNIWNTPVKELMSDFSPIAMG